MTAIQRPEVACLVSTMRSVVRREMLTAVLVFAALNVALGRSWNQIGDFLRSLFQILIPNFKVSSKSDGYAPTMNLEAAFVKNVFLFSFYAKTGRFFKLLDVLGTMTPYLHARGGTELPLPPKKRLSNPPVIAVRSVVYNSTYTVMALMHPECIIAYNSSTLLQFVSQ